MQRAAAIFHSRSMSPSPTAAPMSPASVPPLDDEHLLQEILLRLPTEPSSLPRASLVCKRWRNILLDPGFLRRFRRHHQKPPLLGFFVGLDGRNAVFLPTLDAPDHIPKTRLPLPLVRHELFEMHGCRHGLAILINHRKKEAVVWDPLTGHRRYVPFPPQFGHWKHSSVQNGAVFCSASEEGHAHGDCRLSSYRLVLVCNDIAENRVLACLYDSESGVWGDIITVATARLFYARPSIFVGSSLFWLLDGGGILELDLERQSLAVIEKPTNFQFAGWWHSQVIWTKEGGLGLAILSRVKLSMQLWGRGSKDDGTVRWMLLKTIQLKELLPVASLKDRKKTNILGYDEDSNTIVLYTVVGVLMVQLESMKFKNIGESKYATYYPYRNFYTAGLQEASRVKTGVFCPVQGCVRHSIEPPDGYVEE